MADNEDRRINKASFDNLNLDKESDRELNDLIEDTRKNLETLNFSNKGALKSGFKKGVNESNSRDIKNNPSEGKSLDVLNDNLKNFEEGIQLQDAMSGPGISQKTFKPPEDWANAPEFYPKNFFVKDEPLSELPKTYAEVVGHAPEEEFPLEGAVGFSHTELCPYAMMGECRFGDQCMFIHGITCEYCGQACLDPNNTSQREKHVKECIEQHEKDMELSFAMARSNDKTCGICMEIIMEKAPAGEQRFGILPSCSHCYCLACIRRWRQARQFENKVIRACPECRVSSDFVCPSRFWVETKEEKDKLLESYKIALSKKTCRYYKSGQGVCPFGNRCFYLHALPNGVKVDVGPPRRNPRRTNANGVTSETQPVSILEFLEEWELQWMDLEDFMEMLESDESEWSDELDLDDFYT